MSVTPSPYPRKTETRHFPDGVRAVFRWWRRRFLTYEDGIRDGRQAASEIVFARPVDGNWHSPTARWISLNVNPPSNTPEPYQRAYRLGRNEIADDLVLRAVGFK